MELTSGLRLRVGGGNTREGKRQKSLHKGAGAHTHLQRRWCQPFDRTLAMVNGHPIGIDH